MRNRLATAMLIVAGLFLALGGVVSILAGCAPGERLGLVEGDICVCPGDPDAGPADATPPDAAAHAFGRLYLLGDSIMYGSGAGYNYLKPVYLLSQTYPGTVVGDCYPGWHLFQFANTAALRTSTVARILAGGPPTEWWIELSTNDMSKWTSVAFGAGYRALIDEFHAASPATLVYCQTAIYRTGIDQTTLESYRAAVRTACADRSWAHVVEGVPMVSPANYYDAAHPNGVGYRTEYAPAIRSAVGW